MEERTADLFYSTGYRDIAVAGVAGKQLMQAW